MPDKVKEMTKKPNTLVIWGDDIGTANLSCYSHGVMGYKTPNIDRTRQGGHDVYRLLWRTKLHRRTRPFITGQSVDPHWSEQSRDTRRDDRSQAEDPTIAELLKPLGYATGQFGKNHLGDRNEYLPTVHGFDEFFGNLYHLNAEEEPELSELAAEEGLSEVQRKFCSARRAEMQGDRQGRSDRRPRYGRVGKQVIEDTGPLTKKRMETCDDEFVAAAKDFIKRRTRPASHGSSG